jgi:RNA 2',3'-cyclic 3'-phosphodiesterase
MRRFVAMPVAAHVTAALDAALVPVRAAVPDLRWTEPSGWHVTVAFLRSLPDERLEELVAAVRPVAADVRPLVLRLGAPVVFAGATLVVEVADTPAGATTALGDRVQDAILAAGLPVERRAVRPHVTLARAPRGGIEPRVVAGVRVAGQVADARVPSSWTAPAIEVWSSSGASHGRGYTLDASVPLLG